MASEAPKSPELSAEFGAKEQEIQKFKKEELKIDEKEADKDIIKEENLDKESDRIAAEIEEAKKVLDPVYADKLTAKLDNIITGAKTELTGRLKTINQGSEKTLKEIYDRTWDRLKGFDRDPEVAVLKLFADKKNDIAQIPEMQITTYKSGSGFYKVINGKLAEKDITENAIKMAQKILGITVDGKVGPQTIMALSKMLMLGSDVKFGNKTMTSGGKELDEQGKAVEPKQKKEKAEKPKAAKAPEKPTAPPAAAQPASGPPPATPEKTAPEEPDRQKAEAEKTEGDIGLLRKDLEARKTEFTGENLQKSILEKLTIKKTPPEITAAIKQKITDAKFDKTMADMLAKTESQLNIADASEDPAAVGLLLGEVKMSMLSLTIKSFLQTPEVKALTGRLEGPMNKVNELMEKYPDKKYSKEKNILIQKIIEFIMNESRTLDIASLEENFQKTEEQKPSTPEPRPAEPESEGRATRRQPETASPKPPEPKPPEPAAARAPEKPAESPPPAKTVPKVPPTSPPPNPQSAPPPQPQPAPKPEETATDKTAEAEIAKADIGLLRKDLDTKKREITPEKLQADILAKLTTEKTPPEITAAIKQKIIDAKFDQSIAAMIAKAESSLSIADTSEDPAAIIPLLGDANETISSLTIENFLQTPEVKALTDRLIEPMNSVNNLMKIIPDQWTLEKDQTRPMGEKVLQAKQAIIEATVAFINNKKAKFDITPLEKNLHDAIEEEKPPEWIKFDSPEWKEYEKAVGANKDMYGGIPKFAGDAVEFSENIKNFTGIIFFTSQWCGPCKRIKPFLKQLADEKPGLKLKAQATEQVSTVFDRKKIYSVDKTPILFYFKNGQVQKTIEPNSFLRSAEKKEEEDVYDKNKVMKNLRSMV